MNMLLRNVFYAVGITTLFAMQGLDAKTAQFSDLVKIVQSPLCMHMVLAISFILVVVDAMMSVLGQKGVAVSPEHAPGSTASSAEDSTAHDIQSGPSLSNCVIGSFTLAMVIGCGTWLNPTSAWMLIAVPMPMIYYFFAYRRGSKDTDAQSGRAA